jgi:hypothetical protein
LACTVLGGVRDKDFPIGFLGGAGAAADPGEAYLGRRSAAQVLAGRLRRETGETIRAVLLYGDLRSLPSFRRRWHRKRCRRAQRWFDRIAGAVHAFGGEVLKFIGDGVLAIFPIGEGDLLPRLPFGMPLHTGELLWGNIGTADRLDPKSGKYLTSGFLPCAGIGRSGLDSLTRSALKHQKTRVSFCDLRANAVGVRYVQGGTPSRARLSNPIPEPLT